MNKYLVKISWEATDISHYVQKFHAELFIWADDEAEAKQLAIISLWETDIKKDLLEEAMSSTTLSAEDVT